MIVVDVRPRESGEVPLGEDHDVFEHLSATTTDPTLSRSVLPWASIRGANGIDAERPDERDDGRAEDGVPVEDEILRLTRDSPNRLEPNR